MRKSYKIFLAILLVVTMITSMGTSPFIGFAEDLGDIGSSVESEDLGLTEESEDEDSGEESEDEDLGEESEDEDSGEESEDDGSSEESEDDGSIEEAEDEESSEESEDEDSTIKLGNIALEVATLIVTHNVIQEGFEEMIKTDLIEDIEVGKVVLIEKFKLEDKSLRYLGNPLEEFTILEGQNTINLYYEIIPKETKTKLIVKHILIKEDIDYYGNPIEIEEIIKIEEITRLASGESIEKGTVILKESLNLNYEELKYREYNYLWSLYEEYIVSEGINEIELYYEIKVEEIIIEYTDLTINHVLRFDYQADDVMTELIENLEVGRFVYSDDYIVDYDGINFIACDMDEILLVEGFNMINIYYELANEDEYIAENPDFTLGYGGSSGSTYIQEFKKGSLGPFVKSELFDTRNVQTRDVRSYTDEKNNKAWPEAGSLNIKNTGESIEGKGNQWEISLEIEGKNRVESSDIVLAIDRSSSMKGNKIYDAKNAAKEFVNTLLNDPSKTHIRIAIVSFAGDVSVDSNFKDYSGKVGLISAIDGIYANGASHIQAGLRQANALLYGSRADHKNLVLFGDGAATYSYQLNNPNSYLEDWKKPYSISYSKTTSHIPESGFDYGSNIGNGNAEYTQYEQGGGGWYGSPSRYSNNYSHGAHAIAEAGFGKVAGHNIYTIALNSGPEGNTTFKEVASPGKNYSSPSSSNLNIIFQEVAGKIFNAATNAVITLPLGDMYSILGINTSNYNDYIKVSHGTVNYHVNNKTITWDIGIIDEGRKYWMKYNLALDYSAKGGVFYPTNKPTYIDYENIDSNAARKYFPIAKFRLRTLTLTNNVINGNADQEFDIVLKGPSGPHSKTWTLSLKDKESKTIKGLLTGSYTINGIGQMNYETRGVGNIRIKEDDWILSSRITNRKLDSGWFSHGDELVKTYKVGLVKEDNTSRNSLPNERKSVVSKLEYFIIPYSVEENYKNKGQD